MIPLGLEPKTYCLEGSCSNPTELRNQQLSHCGCKGSENRRQYKIKTDFIFIVEMHPTFGEGQRCDLMSCFVFVYEGLDAFVVKGQGLFKDLQSGSLVSFVDEGKCLDDVGIGVAGCDTHA